MIKPKVFAISLSHIVYAEPQKVFDALTQEGKIGEWCDGGGKVDPEIDGNFEMFEGWVKGKVLKYNSKKKELSYTWKPSEWDKKTAPSIVNYTFNKHPAGTELLIEHSNFPSQEEADKHLNGWTDFVLEPLNDYFTT